MASMPSGGGSNDTDRQTGTVKSAALRVSTLSLLWYRIVTAVRQVVK